MAIKRAVIRKSVKVVSIGLLSFVLSGCLDEDEEAGPSITVTVSGPQNSAPSRTFVFGESFDSDERDSDVPTEQCWIIPHEEPELRIIAWDQNGVRSLTINHDGSFDKIVSTSPISLSAASARGPDAPPRNQNPDFISVTTVPREGEVGFVEVGFEVDGSNFGDDEQAVDVSVTYGIKPERGRLPDPRGEGAPLAEGIYNVRVEAVDAAGNSSFLQLPELLTPLSVPMSNKFCSNGTIEGRPRE